MNPSDTGTLYDTIAARWADQSFDSRNGIPAHERALQWVSSFKLGLDVGCGCSGRFVELMLSRGMAVTGIDVSGEMIALAQQRHPNVSFQQADVCQWETHERYDFISAWDCLWHIPLREQAAVYGKLMGALSSNGVLVFSFGGLDETEEKMDASMGPNLYYSTLGTPRLLELIEANGCVCRHLEFDQMPESHAFAIVQRIT